MTHRGEEASLLQPQMEATTMAQVKVMGRVSTSASRMMLIVTGTSLTAGILSVIFGIVGMVLACTKEYDVGYIFNGYGVWCSIPIITTTSVTMASSKSTSVSLMVASVVLSIVACHICWIQIGFSLTDVIVIAKEDEYQDNIKGKEVGLPLNVFLLILGLTQFVTSVWMSVLTCRAISHGTFTIVTYREQNQNIGGFCVQQQMQLPPAYSFSTVRASETLLGQQVNSSNGSGMERPTYQVPPGAAVHNNRPPPPYDARNDDDIPLLCI